MKTDYTHNIPNANRFDVISEIMNHLVIAKRIADVQDCISIEELKKIDQLIYQVKEVFKIEDTK